jgi:hypothetical protein
VWTCLVVVGSIAGCSSDSPCSVSGQATFDGAPIPDGNIRLDPMGDTPGPGGAAKIVEGKYEIPRDSGMLAGKHQVLISATRATGRQVRAENLDGGPSTTAEIVQYIPERYNTSSEEDVDLEPGENSEDFDLRSD